MSRALATKVSTPKAAKMPGVTKAPSVIDMMVFPRDRNPYQDLLYAGLEPSGVEAVYVGELTRSHTLNIVLLPFEIMAGRIRGRRLLHVHWIFGFAVPLTRRVDFVRRLCLWWYQFFLFTARCCGVHVVWTVHNVVPHEKVFPDDVAARRALVKTCSLVVAHSEAALAEVHRLFGAPRAALVLPIGPYVLATTHERVARPVRDDRFHVVFVGTITRYKGIDDLIAAFADDDVRRCARLTIAGAGNDAQFEDQLRERAEAVGATTRFEYLPDGELRRLLEDADLVALPLRKAATSSTAVLALTAGVPVALPDDAALQALPAAAIIRYDGTPSGLAAAIVRTARLGTSDRAAMTAAARTWAGTLPSWRDIGDDLAAALLALIGDPRCRPPTTRSTSTAKGHEQ